MKDKTLSTMQALGVIWNGSEVPGFTLYGYWVSQRANPPTLCLTEWPRAKLKPAQLSGPDWTVWLWDIKVDNWPSATKWKESILNLLRQIIDSGAQVAWGGLEGLFSEPPDLFLPYSMSGAVWAALDREGHALGPPPLDLDFVTLTDAEMQHLHQVITGGRCV